MNKIMGRVSTEKEEVKSLQQYLQFRGPEEGLSKLSREIKILRWASDILVRTMLWTPMLLIRVRRFKSEFQF